MFFALFYSINYKNHKINNSVDCHSILMNDNPNAQAYDIKVIDTVLQYKCTCSVVLFLSCFPIRQYLGVNRYFIVCFNGIVKTKQFDRNIWMFCKKIRGCGRNIGKPRRLKESGHVTEIINGFYGNHGMWQK